MSISFVNNRRDCFAQKFIVSEFPINVRKKCESPRFSDPLFVPFLVTLMSQVHARLVSPKKKNAK